MQSNRGLVEHVECADQSRAQGGSQLDALGFASGKGGSETVEGDVLQADRVEEV